MVNTKEQKAQVKKAIKVMKRMFREHLGDRRENIESMFFNEKDGIYERFVNAPASHRTDYHSAYPGGLLVHSVQVAKRLFQLAEAWDFKPSKGNESLVIVGLLHDIGKIGCAEGEYYVPVQEEWKREKLGQVYDFNQDILQMPSYFYSAYIFQYFGVYLEVEEHQAILCQAGRYTGTGSDIRHWEAPLTLLLHWAKYWSHFQDRI